MLQCCHWKRWKSDYLAKLRRRDVLIGVPLSKWMDFQLGFFARKLVVGITQHLSALGVLGLAGKLHIRRARSSNFHPFQKFTSLSDGNKISHHCQIKRGSHWFVETSSHLPCRRDPWNIKRYWVLVVEKPIESLLEKQLSKSLKGSSTLQAVESL